MKERKIEREGKIRKKNEGREQAKEGMRAKGRGERKKDRKRK